MKRIIALFSIIVILFSTVFCPMASANVITDYSQSNFAQTLVSIVLTSAGGTIGGPLGAVGGLLASAGFSDLASWYAAGHTDTELYSAYASEVSTIQSDLGTTTVGNNCFYLPVMVTAIDNWYNDGSQQWTASFDSNKFSALGVMYGTYSQVYVHCDGALVVPVSGYYALQTPWTGTGGVSMTTRYGFNGQSRNHYSAGATLKAYSDNKAYLLFYGNSYDNSCSLSGSVYYKVEPDNYDINTFTTNYGGSSGRAGVLTGSYSSGDTYYENTTIVNETEKTFYDPTTGTTTAYDHFVYDYATRTYTLYDASGNVIAVITYGDEQLTISQGGVDTGLNYAVPADDPEEPDPGNSDSNNGLFTALGNFLADGVDWIVDKLNLLADSINGILGTFNQYVAGLADKAGTFPAFLTAAFACIPEDLTNILWFSVVCVVVVAVWKKWFS